MSVDKTSFSIFEFISHADLDRFCRKYHIQRLLLFGSALHGALTPTSDIDLLVEFSEDQTPDLFELSRMEIELSSIIKRKVDLRTPEEISRYFRDDIYRQARIQYEAA